MYIAMNRFKVAPDMAEAFEESWRTRQSFLKDMPGFVEFHMLKGHHHGEHILYASHTVWRDRDAFEAWTRSEAFGASHRRAGGGSPKLFLGHPEFEGFEVFQHIAA
ncbi:antibiotic biosynthesis monooxygenase family protein [Jiella mangrovi]|uniref:Antibiotic biosynthesis monooxygenase n=1 Tax=Jiella mangrovi TaxID=2821407 RepID=A0ABS4BHM3_9HYPH|nr:antibiotic biosynthesis monooxygenase [Jiella mangrovi]MBP0616241.1 antibiotic biosynthesis monooxygenase [Jiella mangrovi]